MLTEDKSGLAVQVIENQARTNLSNRDLATVVNRLFGDGMKIKQIAAICSLKEYQIAAFRSVERLPPVLADRLDQALPPPDPVTAIPSKVEATDPKPVEATTPT